MGDIADYYLDQEIEDIAYRYRRRLPPLLPIRMPVCRNCGAICYWTQRGDRFVLFDAHAPHVCKPEGVIAHAMKAYA